MTRTALLLLAGSSLLLGCEAPLALDPDPVVGLAPEGRVDAAAHPGAAAIGGISAWRNGPPVAAGDLDGDGRDDLVLERWIHEAYEQETRLVYGGARPGRRGELSAIGPAIRTLHAPAVGVVALGDLDGDGGGELLLRDATSRLLPGGSRLAHDVDTSVPHLPMRTTSPRTFFPVGDVDGDGTDDVGVVTDSAELGLWLGGPDVLDADGSLAPNVQRIRGAVSEPLHFGLHLAPGDLDADGLDDIVYDAQGDADTGTSGIEILYGRADASFGADAPDARLVPDAYRILAGLGDFDGDGRAELLSRTHDGDVALARVVPANGASRLVGQHAFASSAVRLTDERLSDLAWAGDLDADGTDDIAGMRDLGERGAEVLVWYGRVGVTELPDAPDATIGFPVAMTGVPSPNVGDSAFAVRAAGDLDGDGPCELAVTTDGTLWLFYGGPRTPM